MARGGDEGTAAAAAEGAAEGAAAVETGSRAAAEAPLERLLQEEVRSLLPGAAELRERAELSRRLEAVIKAGWEGGQLDLASLGWRAAHPNPSPPKPNPNPNPIPNLNPHPSLKPKLTFILTLTLNLTLTETLTLTLTRAVTRRAAQPPSLVLFGSSASNLHSTGADLDMTLLIDLPHPAQCSVVRQLERTYPYPYPYP